MCQQASATFYLFCFDLEWYFWLEAQERSKNFCLVFFSCKKNSKHTNSQFFFVVFFYNLPIFLHTINNWRHYNSQHFLSVLMRISKKSSTLARLLQLMWWNNSTTTSLLGELVGQISMSSHDMGFESRCLIKRISWRSKNMKINLSHFQKPQKALACVKKQGAQFWTVWKAAPQQKLHLVPLDWKQHELDCSKKQSKRFLEFTLARWQTVSWAGISHLNCHAGKLICWRVQLGQFPVGQGAVSASASSCAHTIQNCGPGFWTQTRPQHSLDSEAQVCAHCLMLRPDIMNEVVISCQQNSWHIVGGQGWVGGWSVRLAKKESCFFASCSCVTLRTLIFFRFFSRKEKVSSRMGWNFQADCQHNRANVKVQDIFLQKNSKERDRVPCSFEIKLASVVRKFYWFFVFLKGWLGLVFSQSIVPAMCFKPRKWEGVSSLGNFIDLK